MEISSVIIKPYLTEKTQSFKSFSDPKMSFVVNKKANKNQIAYSFQQIFGIKPRSVNVVNRKPSPARFMNKNNKNYHKAFKIAFITIKKEDYEKLSEDKKEG